MLLTRSCGHPDHEELTLDSKGIQFIFYAPGRGGLCFVLGFGLWGLQ